MNPVSGTTGGVQGGMPERIARFDDAWKKIELGAGAGAREAFGATLAGAISRVSESQDIAAEYATAFANGENVELHQVMAASEEAGIALEVLVELRNKVVDAYHTLVNMQG